MIPSKDRYGELNPEDQTASQERAWKRSHSLNDLRRLISSRSVTNGRFGLSNLVKTFTIYWNLNAETSH